MPIPDLLNRLRTQQKTSVDGGKSCLDSLIAFLLFGCVFTVYLNTLCPTIYTGDDGDFITAMATFGVPHPTGYPLFCLIGRLFLLLPGSNPAFKINLMTAFFGAVSVGFVYRFLAVLLGPLGHRYVAATGAFLFAFAPTMWQQSLSCEVYSLTALFLALLLFLAARWQKDPQNNDALLTLTFAFGLSLTNHLTIALLFPAFLAFVLYQRPALLGRDWKLLLPMAAVFVLPLSLYLYLPLAAHNKEAPVNWGMPTTLQAFWEHVTGDEFRPLMFQSGSVAIGQAGDYTGYLRDEFGIPLLLLAPLGIVFFCRKRSAVPQDRLGNLCISPRKTERADKTVRTDAQRSGAICCLLLSVGLITTFYAFNYQIFDIYVYYIPSYMVVACLISLGMSACISGFQDWRGVSPGERIRITPLIALVVLMFPILPMSYNYESSSKSGNYIEDDFTRNILASSPPNSLVITSSNVILALWYRRFVLGERQDVVPIHQGMMRGLVFWNGWYAKHLYRMYPDMINTYPGQKIPLRDASQGKYTVTMMRRAVERGVPVIIVPDPRFDLKQTNSQAADVIPFDEQVAAAGLVRVPWGVCDRVYLKGHEPTAEQVVAANVTLRPFFRFRGVYEHTWAFADPMQRHITLRYLDADEALAKAAQKAGRYSVAIEALDRALKLNDLPELRAARAQCLAKQGNYPR